MRRLIWSPTARRSFRAYLRYLRAAAPAYVAEASAEITEAAGRLARLPFLGRPSRWSGFREVSLLRWRKIFVYRVDADRVVIMLFVDSRQDLTKVDPRQ